MDEVPLQWYHLILSTYGSWLSGDQRGFRTRHHRTHVEGDCKNPPSPGAFADWLRFSKDHLKQPPVVLTPAWRALLGTALREAFRKYDHLVICLAVSGKHIHALAKLPCGAARNIVGDIKRHLWFEARDRGWRGKLWGKRCQPITVRDRAHQLNVFHYILRHTSAGAWVWSFRDES